MYFYYQSLLRAMTQNFTLVPVIKKKAQEMQQNPDKSSFRFVRMCLSQLSHSCIFSKVSASSAVSNCLEYHRIIHWKLVSSMSPHKSVSYLCLISLHQAPSGSSHDSFSPEGHSAGRCCDVVGLVL